MAGTAIADVAAAGNVSDFAVMCETVAGMFSIARFAYAANEGSAVCVVAIGELEAGPFTVARIAHAANDDCSYVAPWVLDLLPTQLRKCYSRCSVTTQLVPAMVWQLLIFRQNQWSQPSNYRLLTH